MAETETGPEVGRVFQALERAGNHCLLYLVTEENEDAPGALVEKMIDLIGWEGREFSQFPQELYSTEFIQRYLLIKAWGCGQHRGRSQWGVPLPRGQSNSSLGGAQMGRSKGEKLTNSFPFSPPIPYFWQSLKLRGTSSFKNQWDTI